MAKLSALLMIIIVISLVKITIQKSFSRSLSLSSIPEHDVSCESFCGEFRHVRRKKLTVPEEELILPWTAFITKEVKNLIKKNTQEIHQGILISTKHVLSNNFKIELKESDKLFIRLGEKATNKNAMKESILKISHFKKIVLLELEHPVNFHERPDVRPICLARLQHNIMHRVFNNENELPNMVKTIFEAVDKHGKRNGKLETIYAHDTITHSECGPYGRTLSSSGALIDECNNLRHIMFGLVPSLTTSTSRLDTRCPFIYLASEDYKTWIEENAETACWHHCNDAIIVSAASKP